MKSIRDVMHGDVRTCRDGDDLESVAMTMWNGDCGAVPIVDEYGRAIGIVTDRDIAMAAALKHRPLWDIGVGEVKPGADLYSCRPGDSVQAALHLMSERRVRRLVVQDDDGRLEGIVSIKDLLDHADGRQKGQTKALSTEQALTALREICRANRQDSAA